jgi:hypothetical protein
MKIKITFLTLCALLFALSLRARAQQTGKVARIGFLDQSTASGSAVLVEAFRQELSKLGWIEGKNITVEYVFVIRVRHAGESGFLKEKQHEQPKCRSLEPERISNHSGRCRNWSGFGIAL